MIQIQVVRFRQQGYTLYSGVMRIGQLMDCAVTTEWDPGLGWEIEGQGYQRAPVPEHYRRIANFLRREVDPLLPNSALLASRNMEYGKLTFTSIDDDLGYLEIPDTRRLFIIDYQHRWRGFKHAIEEFKQVGLCEVVIPVTILADTPLPVEMKQFYLINNKQKRVDTDLALTLMHAMSSEQTEEELANLVGPGNRYRIRATRLVIRIAQLDSGPWAGRIQEPNVQPNKLQVATIKSFVDSLRPIVSTRSPVHALGDDELIYIIDSVWEGVLSLHPEWKDEPDKYAIQHAIGLFVMHRVARELLIPLMIGSGDFSTSFVERILLSQKEDLLGRDYWKTGGQIGASSSGAGQRELAERIVGGLWQGVEEGSLR